MIGRRLWRQGSNRPDLFLLDGVVAPGILNAMARASKMMSESGVPHALVGGLAVGAYGYPRATKDVDFLVGDEAFTFHAGGVVTMAPGVPMSIDAVAVDSLSIPPGQTHLADAIKSSVWSCGIPVAPIGVLVYLKLTSPRKKDAADIVELVKAGIDQDAVRKYLSMQRDGLLLKFNELVDEAMGEME